MGKNNKKSKYSIVMLEKRKEVTELIEKGFTLTEINDNIFDYDDYNTFTKRVRMESPELMKRYKEIKNLKKYIK